jgi:aminotransferase EvaB
MTRVTVWDYYDEYKELREQILAAVDRVFSSGRLILGEEVAGFEREFAAYCGAKYAVGVDNGTNAIVLALQAVGVGPGDEVITVSNTAAPTVVAIRNAGARAVFVDIDPATGLMDVSALDQVIGPRTRCILPVHLFGQCVDMDAIEAIARSHGLAVIEDCAQAPGADWRGRRAGSMGDAAAFSFYPTKVIGAYGDGGAVLTNGSEIERRLRQLRYYGMGDDRYYVFGQGMNARLDEVQAAILRLKLTRLEEDIAARRAIADRYRRYLAGTNLILPRETGKGRHVYYIYVVRHPSRDELLQRLKEENIHLNISYPWPIHTMTGFSELGYSQGDLPNTEEAATEVFSLPMYPGLSLEKQDRVCDVLKKLLDAL